MKTIATILSLFVSLIFIQSCLANEHTYGFNLGATSNYVWRGLNQSDDNPSISAGFDYGHSSGAYAGIWVATVDYNDDTNAEHDFLVVMKQISAI